MISLCTSAPSPQRVSGPRYTGWRIIGSGDLHVGCSTATQNRRQIPLKGCYVSWGFPGFALPSSGIPVPPRSDQQTFGCPPKHAKERQRKAIRKASVDLLVREAAWPSGQRVGLAIRRSRVQVPLWLLAGFVFGRPEFKSSAMLVNSQLVASYQLGF